MLHWSDSHVLLFALAFALSLGAGLLIVLTARWHLRYTADANQGVQKVHSQVTSRAGGLGIMLALYLVWQWVMAIPSLDLDITDLPHLLGLLLLAAIPAFGFGLMEDLSGRIGLNALLASTPVALAFTVLAVATVANGFNIVDGFNGLSSGIATLAFFVFSLMAQGVGDLDLHLLCLVFAGTSFGFFVINWPWGRLFLGDGGAYLLGFVKHRFVNRMFVGRGKIFRNSATGLVIVLLGAVGQFLACLTIFSVTESVIAFAALVLLYLLLYARIVYFRWAPPWQLLRLKPGPAKQP